MCLKKTKIELELLIDIDVLQMIEKGIKNGICHAIHPYTKANNKYTKNYNKNEESSCLMYWVLKNLYGWAIS